MKLIYIFHSGFVIEGNGYSILIDYYKDTGKTNREGFIHNELLKRSDRLYIMASHFHPDHFNPEILKWKDERKNIIYVLSKDILKHKRANKEDAIYIKKGDSYQDDHICIEAFGSTDSGDSFLINAHGKQIFHAGDLNNWHWQDESTPQEAAQSEKNYLKELEDIAKRTDHLDLALFPVDPRIGTNFMRGAQQFVSQIKTDLFVPMHFWSRPEEIKSFKAIAEAHGSKFALLSVPGESIEF